MKRLAHERHPWLVALPVLAILLTIVADFVFDATGDARWWLLGRPVLAVGTAGLIVAIGAAFLDLRDEPEGETRAVEGAYLGVDLTALISLGTQTWLRWVMPVPTDATPGVAWSVITGLLLIGSSLLAWQVMRIHRPPAPVG